MMWTLQCKAPALGPRVDPDAVCQADGHVAALDCGRAGLQSVFENLGVFYLIIACNKK